MISRRNLVVRLLQLKASKDNSEVEVEEAVDGAVEVAEAEVALAQAASPLPAKACLNHQFLKQKPTVKLGKAQQRL